MPLETSCEQFKGQLVFVLPTIGFGWCRKLPATPRFQPGDSIEPPPPFNARVLEFHYFDGGIRGGIGIVEQQNHPLNGEWIGFCVRDGMGTLTCNFSSHPADNNIKIGKTKPVIKIDPKNLAMPEWIQFPSESYLSGLGYIVESTTTIQEIHERIKNAQKSP
jgi:hypothetical protein